MEVLAEVLRGERVARVHSYVAPETIEFMALAKEFGFEVRCFEHIWEGYKIAPELAAAKIGISVFADSWAYKMEAAEGIAYMAGYCAKNGVLVSINSDSGERIRRLFNDAAKTMKYGGLSEDEALRLVTINPAIQLGVDKIVGSLEVGKQGDIAVFSEHPMSAYARCDLTVIEGQVCFDREAVVRNGRRPRKKPRPRSPREVCHEGAARGRCCDGCGRGSRGVRCRGRRRSDGGRGWPTRSSPSSTPGSSRSWGRRSRRARSSSRAARSRRWAPASPSRPGPRRSTRPASRPIPA